VYIRSTGKPSAGLDALRVKGAMPWPNPQDIDALQAVFDIATSTPVQPPQSGLALFSGDGTTDVGLSMPSVAEPPPTIEAPNKSVQPPSDISCDPANPTEKQRMPTGYNIKQSRLFG